MNIQTWVAKKEFNVEEVLKLANTTLSNLRVTYPEHKTVSVMTVAKGSWGPEGQLDEVSKFFDVEISNDNSDLGDAWHSIDSAASEVSNWIDEQAQKQGMTGTFYFQHNDADGDYDLFYSEGEGEE